MNLELRHLRYFLAVAEELHFTRAAERLYMGQPALSARIREIERAVGTPLFRRTTRRVRLTPAGEALLPHARAALEAADRAADALRCAREGLAGPLRVGLVVGTQTVLLSRVLAAYGERHPDVRVEIEEFDFSDPSAGVRSERVDVAFVCAPIDETGLVLEPLERAARVAVLADRHPLAGRDAIGVEELFDDPWPPPETEDRVCRDFWLANEHRTAPPLLGPTTRSLDKLLHLLTTGQVVTLAGDWTLPFFRRPGLAVVRVRNVAPVTIALAWRAGELPPAGARLLEIARDVRAGEGLRAAAMTPARAAGYPRGDDAARSTEQSSPARSTASPGRSTSAPPLRRRG
jgi:DNA-binding transcriptional LysR family regulator